MGRAIVSSAKVTRAVLSRTAVLDRRPLLGGAHLAVEIQLSEEGARRGAPHAVGARARRPVRVRGRVRARLVGGLGLGLGGWGRGNATGI